jgi:glycosyltransferase involved in cell wall biosynthesis
MAAGLTVLASDAVPARRVVEETGCGLWFRGGDPEHMATRMQALWSDPDRGRHGAAGRAAIRERFNWEADRARMVDDLERLA